MICSILIFSHRHRLPFMAGQSLGRSLAPKSICAKGVSIDNPIRKQGQEFL
jgi:hypothetical protein